MIPTARRAMLVILGPTGVGKTDIAFQVARKLGGEIISADSRLVYRMMDIGTAKPDVPIRREIPHHMIDLVLPDRQFTAKDFERQARQVVRDVVDRGRVPVVAGGTGLYVRALLRGIFNGPAADGVLRAGLEEDARREGPEALWRKLYEVDPQKAAQIDPANVVRVIRALEVFRLAGRRMSDLEREARAIDLPAVKVGLNRSPADLRARIESRVDLMMQGGFLEEARRLVEAGYGASRIVRNTLGYRELLRYLDGVTTLEQAVASIKSDTRRFAKRQLTWFAREPQVEWIDLSHVEDADAVSRICREYEDRAGADLSQ